MQLGDNSAVMKSDIKNRHYVSKIIKLNVYTSFQKKI